MALTHWSQIKPEAKKNLRPDLGIKSWDELRSDQKQIIWQHFTNKGWFAADEDTHRVIYRFDSDHKSQAFCQHTLSHGGPHNFDRSDILQQCCKEKAGLDFNHIFHTRPQDVVYELFSYYAEQIHGRTYPEGLYGNFTVMFNDISDQFGLNILLSESGLILRQDKKIVAEIYQPVLKFLADDKWQPVNRDLADAFDDCLKNSPEGFSSAITHAISSLQGFLQIIVNGKIGKGDLAGLIAEAQKKGLIPADRFSERIFKDSLSILMSERQDKGDAHSKNNYADGKTARLVLNLVMVFMQHCLQK